MYIGELPLSFTDILRIGEHPLSLINTGCIDEHHSSSTDTAHINDLGFSSPIYFLELSLKVFSNLKVHVEDLLSKIHFYAGSH
jgi:hypothetical protein